ncbi:hypothetical protein [Nostoc parmelioides]|uniref:Uncharacterized protein n=1 Tax=Nostoc parmelioides FACHB-3921 TaxID=2692909 RepID=A0ABR8BPR8_9NOSO|nr:hypothetical protein [Nostoc parmelioides]MBD2255785.1 hypothetical protein [Nostoc parmelioides FACHB-3921]
MFFLAHSNQAIAPDLTCADSGFRTSLQATTNTAYELLPQSSETFIYLAMLRIIVRRLA